MGIYIKKMEMPESCYYCPFADGVWQKDKRCLINGKEMPRDGRDVQQNHINCPLVPVPPHGRLGDLDSLALLVLNWISTQEKAYPHEDSNALAWRLGAKAMANQIYRDVKAYPTIIEAEEGE